MKVLLKELKSHWIWLVVMILAHVIRAYTTLLLPIYTSGLVDTGIQNEGFEYAVPLAMTPEHAQNLEFLLLPEEVELMAGYYEEDGQNNIVLKDSMQDERSLAQLENTLAYPMAVYQNISQMSEEDRTRALQDWENIDKESREDSQAARSAIVTELATYGDQYIHNAGVQGALGMYHATGRDTRGIQFNYLLSNGGQMLGIALITVASAVFGFYIASRVASGVGRSLRSQMFSKVMDLSDHEIEKFSTASLITRTTNDIQQVTQVLTVVLRAMLFAPILALGGLAYVISLQGSMSWILAVAIALILVAVTILFWLTMPRFKIVQDLFDKVNLIAREILSGLQVIRAFGRQDYERKRFDTANMDLRDNYLFTGRTMSMMMPFMLFILDANSVLVVWFASGQIGAGNMQVGEMMAFISYSMQILMSFLMVSSMSLMLPRSLVALNRIGEVIESPLSIADPDQPKIIKNPKGTVAFNDVSFTYDDADEPAVKNINFTAYPGQTTALIGSTGSGKSTILNLMLRFYDATEGSITIDGVDIRDMSQEQLYDMIGYIPQEGVLFTGTIQSNIGYGVDDISQEEMDKAAAIAHADEFISDKKEGYDSPIAQGGSNVSGGQKQRLSIARAIAKNPQIYAFDDSFSALDYRTDASLRKALNEEVSEATVIIVAQRISTIIDAEQIIVLNDGEIDNIGTHAKLMETSAVYREIAQSQLSATELEAHQSAQLTTLTPGWEG